MVELDQDHRVHADPADYHAAVGVVHVVRKPVVELLSGNEELIAEAVYLGEVDGAYPQRNRHHGCQNDYTDSHSENSLLAITLMSGKVLPIQAFEEHCLG